MRNFRPFGYSPRARKRRRRYVPSTHFKRIRELHALQDETKGFVGFLPLPYQPENNEIPVKTPPTGFDALRTIAVSRQSS